MTVPFMGRDRYFNDKNLFPEIKIKCSSLICEPSPLYHDGCGSRHPECFTGG